MSYTGKRCSLGPLTDHFDDAFVCENIACVFERCGDDMTLTPFCLKKSCLRRGYFNVLATFSVRFRLKSGEICKNNNHTYLRRCGLGRNQVKYARIMITYVWFIASRLAGSLGRCLNTRPNDLVSKQLPWDPANINA